MKHNLLILTGILVFLLSSCADKRKNDDIFSEFEGEKGIYMVKLPPALFLALTGMEDENTSSEDLGDISLVKLLVYSREDASSEETDNMLNRLKTAMNDFEYENILGFNSGKAFVSAYVLDNEEYVSDLMILMRDQESLICLGLSGKLDGQTIFDFATQIEYDKLQNFVSQ